MTVVSHPTTHGDKLDAAIANAKCAAEDVALLREAKEHYQAWLASTRNLKSKGRQRVDEMVQLLNAYKDMLEVELIAKRGSVFIKRQKGQLKLDNSVIEEFLPYLVCRDIIDGLNHTRFKAGPQNAFMSLSFLPHSFASLGNKPEVVIKTKDQDFAIGSTVYYQFSAEQGFAPAQTSRGDFALAVLAAEAKVNLDKTMFQEAAGTAARLKQGCPVARYYLIVEYLDMPPEDTRLTAIDNAYLLRKCKRLPFEKRSIAREVERQHHECPISPDVVWAFVQQIQTFVSAVWYDPEERFVVAPSFEYGHPLASNGEQGGR